MNAYESIKNFDKIPEKHSRNTRSRDRLMIERTREKLKKYSLINAKRKILKIVSYKKIFSHLEYVDIIS